MIARFPTTKWYLCTDGTSVFHFGRVEAGQQLSTGQVDTEVFYTEALLNARLAELGQDSAMLVPASPALSLDQHKQAKADRVWAAALKWEEDHGVAGSSGTSLLALGVLLQVPEAAAIAAWAQTLWADAKVRWDACLVAADAVEADAVSEDFSAHGDKPYRVSDQLAPAVLTALAAHG